MNCPWSEFTPGTTTFCEAKLCSWIESPAIAWAGVSYIIVGIMLFKFRKPTDEFLLRLFPFLAISMGMSSFLYHASHAFIFQLWDVASMFMLGNAIILLNKKHFAFFGAWLLLLAVEILLFYFLQGSSASYILAGLILVFFYTEAQKVRESRTYFSATLGLFGMAVFALLMEKKSGLCSPDNHFFQWHAVWDGFCSLTYLTLYKHFQQEKT